MSQRLSFSQVVPEAYRAMKAFDDYVTSTGLARDLLELVKLRASYSNGCAYCVDMHTKDARLAGEAEQRLFAVPVWRETPFFTPRERAALAWTEAVTDIARADVSDELYREARDHFSEAELVELTMAVIAINGWNRLSVAFRREVGSYQPSRPTG
ncbi:MAG: carboxymuconolactone decarboxylase family protein [Gemmatimonas sp.]|nr:carboxymuconolactone decarboxylase family protein [Gemmatimonadaceae bacterium]